ncbi:Na+/H+ antiporter [Cellulomonas hominis]|uniref:Na+/H+ antiporter n=1 Tax=Cellulomonas hominis TaxID=156981 RepID=UPI001B94D29A|nr:Na+/H+ antiporter [Cellulomonas hominis]VTR77741.1 putative Na(+)/H(+) exchanger [Cellulomonas hominis]
MEALQVVVVLAATIVLGGALAQRLRVAAPVLLLLLGVLLGFAPALRQVHLPPELMLLVFLPALLFWEALTSSLREIRFNLRGVVLTSTVLVALTAGTVAAVAHAFGVAWGPAWVLGAALAPTDATAVAALSRALPRRTVAVLRSESLVNDGTALVLYGVAVGVTVGEESLTAGHLTWLLVLSYGGGVLAGVLVAWLATVLRARLADVLLANVVTLLTPFAAFLLAETVEASGVLAVVVSGLMLSRVGPRLVPAATRRLAESFWSFGTYLLNAALFVLVGLEVQSVLRSVPGDEVGPAVVLAVLVWVTVLAVRLVFLFASAYTIRVLDRRPSQRLRRVSDRSRVVSTVAGFRGAVSLAAALAVPTTIASGQPFPSRDLVVFVTAVVVTLSLVVQGVLLPRVVRWAAFAPDTAPEDERHLAEQVSTREALESIGEVAARLGTDEAVVRRTVAEYEEHLRVVDAQGTADDDDAVRAGHQYAELRLALIARKREAVVRLRDEREIDDSVLRAVQARLDVEELRLSRADVVEE